MTPFHLSLDRFLPTNETHLLANQEEREARQAVVELPALEPMLRLYNVLYSLNYSVAFVTGRSELAREFTTSNLASAGYGSMCPPGERTEAPCYVALQLRQNGDVRYASVYKPEARGLLQKMGAGYEVVGNFGDQFSDLVGLNAATPGSFKLPNPSYYIL